MAGAPATEVSELQKLGLLLLVFVLCVVWGGVVELGQAAPSRCRGCRGRHERRAGAERERGRSVEPSFTGVNGFGSIRHAAAPQRGAGARAPRSVNDPSAGSPTETLLRLLLPLNDKVRVSFRHNELLPTTEC